MRNAYLCFEKKLEFTEALLYNKFIYMKPLTFLDMYVLPEIARKLDSAIAEQEGEQPMTIYDISEKAGVSIATVSRVLNGSSNVSEKTRQKVLKVMEENDYTPNAFARGLGLNTMKTIGILCADSSDLYLAKAIYYIERSLRANGYDSLLCCTGYDLDNKMKGMDLLLSKKVDSVILVGSNFIGEKNEDNKYIREAAKDIPVMLLNAALDSPNVYSIVSDDTHSMYEAACALISCGISDILYFYNSNSYSGKHKLAGYQAAMEEAGLPSMTHYYAGSHEDIPAMRDSLVNAAAKGCAFHGLIAADDSLALAAVKYAKQQKLSIPRDLSVIGYNNSILAYCCEPELTSIDNKLETLCQQLIDSLMGVLSGKDIPKKILFSGELIKRGTTPF